MSDREFEALRQRVDTLERQNRRLRGISLVALLILLPLLLAAASPSSRAFVVKVNGLILVDAQGKKRAELYVDDRRTGLDFFDRNGDLLASLGAGQQGAGLSFWAPWEGAQPRARVAWNEDGSELTLYSSDQQNSVVFSTSNQGPNLLLADKDSFRSSLGRISLVAAESGERENTSAASVVLLGKDGEVLWRAP